MAIFLKQEYTLFEALNPCRYPTALSCWMPCGKALRRKGTNRRCPRANPRNYSDASKNIGKTPQRAFVGKVLELSFTTTTSDTKTI